MDQTSHHFLLQGTSRQAVGTDLFVDREHPMVDYLVVGKD